MKLYIKVLEEIEIRIEKSYLALHQLEINGLKESKDYEYYFQYLNEYINKEMKLISKMVELFNLKDIYQEILKLKITLKEIPLTLGHLPDAQIYRLINLIDMIRGDDIIDYASTLKTDIKHLLLAFLDAIISDDNYQEIRNDLILYKYNLIYLDPNLENEFINNDLILEDINLQANNYRTFDLPGYKYVDNSILAFESTDYLAYITSHDDFTNSKREYSLMVISIINVLARLILCEQDTLDLVYDDLRNILESSTTPIEVKELIHNMHNILDSIKSHIAWAR